MILNEKLLHLYIYKENNDNKTTFFFALQPKSENLAICNKCHNFFVLYHMEKLKTFNLSIFYVDSVYLIKLHVTRLILIMRKCKLIFFKYKP